MNSDECACTEDGDTPPPSPTLPIARLRLDGGTQSRAGVDRAAVSTYAEVLRDGGELDPVLVVHDGTSHWLVDGFHRVAAYTQEARAEIPVDVRQGAHRDAVRMSLAANASHGLPRTQADKERAVRVALEDSEWSRLSNRQIAAMVRVSHTFVNGLRREVEGRPAARPSPAAPTPLTVTRACPCCGRRQLYRMPEEGDGMGFFVDHGCRADGLSLMAATRLAEQPAPGNASTPAPAPTAYVAPTGLVTIRDRLDPLRHLAGMMSDHEFAEMAGGLEAGVTASIVGRYRQIYGIHPFIPHGSEASAPAAEPPPAPPPFLAPSLVPPGFSWVPAGPGAWKLYKETAGYWHRQHGDPLQIVRGTGGQVEARWGRAVEAFADVDAAADLLWGVLYAEGSIAEPPPGEPAPTPAAEPAPPPAREPSPALPARSSTAGPILCPACRQSRPYEPGPAKWGETWKLHQEGHFLRHDRPDGRPCAANGQSQALAHAMHAAGSGAVPRAIECPCCRRPTPYHPGRAWEPGWASEGDFVPHVVAGPADLCPGAGKSLKEATEIAKASAPPSTVVEPPAPEPTPTATPTSTGTATGFELPAPPAIDCNGLHPAAAAVLREAAFLAAVYRDRQDAKGLEECGLRAGHVDALWAWREAGYPTLLGDLRGYSDPEDEDCDDAADCMTCDAVGTQEIDGALLCDDCAAVVRAEQAEEDSGLTADVISDENSEGATTTTATLPPDEQYDVERWAKHGIYPQLPDERRSLARAERQVNEIMAAAAARDQAAAATTATTHEWGLGYCKRLGCFALSSSGSAQRPCPVEQTTADEDNRAAELAEQEERDRAATAGPPVGTWLRVTRSLFVSDRRARMLAQELWKVTEILHYPEGTFHRIQPRGKRGLLSSREQGFPSAGLVQMIQDGALEIVEYLTDAGERRPSMVEHLDRQDAKQAGGGR